MNWIELNWSYVNGSSVYYVIHKLCCSGIAHLLLTGALNKTVNQSNHSPKFPICTVYRSDRIPTAALTAPVPGYRGLCDSLYKWDATSQAGLNRLMKLQEFPDNGEWSLKQISFNTGELEHMFISWIKPLLTTNSINFSR